MMQETTTTTESAGAAAYGGIVIDPEEMRAEYNWLAEAADHEVLQFLSYVLRPYDKDTMSFNSWAVWQTREMRRALLTACLERDLQLHFALTSVNAEIAGEKERAAIYEQKAKQIKAKAASLMEHLEEVERDLLLVVQEHGKTSAAGNSKLEIGGSVFRTRRSERVSVKPEKLAELAELDGGRFMNFPEPRPALTEIKRALKEGGDTAKQLDGFVTVEDHYGLNY